MLSRKTSRLRILVLVMSLLALAGQGFGAGIQGRGCREHMAAMQSDGHKAKSSSSMAHDCCPTNPQSGTGDLPAKGTPGSNSSCTLCKVGLTCDSAQPFEPSALLSSFVVPGRPVLSTRSVVLLSTHSPDGLWRPPAVI
jgi:hypothetical protein